MAGRKDERPPCCFECRKRRAEARQRRKRDRAERDRAQKAGQSAESGTRKRDKAGPQKARKRDRSESEKAGQVRYWRYGQAEKSPDLAISDPSLFPLPRGLSPGVQPLGVQPLEPLASRSGPSRLGSRAARGQTDSSRSGSDPRLPDPEATRGYRNRSDPEATGLPCSV